MMMKHFLAALAFLLFAGTAGAQTAVTVTNSSAQIMARNTRNYLSVCNQHATATMYFCFADTSGSCTAVAATAGQYTVGPLQCLTFTPPARPPSEKIFAISTVASNPATVNEK